MISLPKNTKYDELMASNSLTRLNSKWPVTTSQNISTVAIYEQD